MQQRAPDYWVTCSGREIVRAGRRGPGAGQPHGHQHWPLVTTTITIYRGLPGNLARALLTIHCSLLATTLYVAEVHDLFSARAVMAWRRLAESRSHMLFLHVGGAGCGCGLEAARSSVFEIFSGVWSAAVCGQQRCQDSSPGPGSGVSPLQLRCCGRVYTCPQCRLYSCPPSSLHRGLPQHNTWRLAGPLYAPWPHLSTVSSGRVLANLYRKLIAGQHCHRQGAEVIHRSNCCCCC